MPRLDGTGPRCGRGMTGHGRGFCENRKPCCKRREECYRDTEYTRDDYIEEKEILEKRLEEVNQALDKKEE